MSDVNIRSYQDGDLEQLKSITIEAFEPVSIERNIEQQTGGPINGRDWRFRKAKHIEADVARDPAGVFVAEIEDKIVGYITTSHDAEDGVGLIPNLAVDANQRGQGIGRSLIQRALDHFRELGLSYARIETLEQNPIGQTFYPSFGFQEIARQIHYGMPLEDES